MNKWIDGVRYHLKTCGEGFPLVLLHGFTGSAETWSSFCSSWGKHSELIMIDLVGHGQTSSPNDLEPYSILNAVHALKELLNERGIEKADVLGYSMGGRVAITFAATYPQMVRKLILESTTPGIEAVEDRRMRMSMDENLATKIESDGLETFIHYWECIPLFQTQQKLPPAVKEQIRSQRMKNNPVGLANSLRGMGTGAQPSWWDKLEEFHFETLLVTGSQDEKFCKIAEKMMTKLPKGRHMSINGCGHAIHVEEPEIFGTIVSEFLSNTY